MAADRLATLDAATAAMTHGVIAARLQALADNFEERSRGETGQRRTDRELDAVALLRAANIVAAAP